MNNHLKVAKTFAHILDSQFRIGPVQFGLDPLLDIIPGIGDIIGAILSCYIIWIGFQMRVPSEKLAEMVMNVLIDFVIGLIPVAGIVGDIFYKANLRNITILEEFGDTVIEGTIVN